jgi:hypothetical protein
VTSREQTAWPKSSDRRAVERVGGVGQKKQQRKSKAKVCYTWNVVMWHSRLPLGPIADSLQLLKEGLTQHRDRNRPIHLSPYQNIFNNILSSASTFSKLSLCLRFPNRNCVRTSRHVCYTYRPSDYCWIDHPKNIWNRNKPLAFLYSEQC